MRQAVTFRIHPFSAVQFSKFFELFVDIVQVGSKLVRVESSRYTDASQMAVRYRVIRILKVQILVPERGGLPEQFHAYQLDGPKLFSSVGYEHELMRRYEELMRIRLYVLFLFGWNYEILDTYRC